MADCRHSLPAIHQNPCRRDLGNRSRIPAFVGIAACIFGLLPYRKLDRAASSFTFLENGIPSGLLWAFIGNIFCLPVQNLIPPYFPFVSQWNEAMTHFVRTPFGSHFQAFEQFGFIAGRGVSEANAGIGLWMFILTFVSIGAAAVFRGGIRRRTIFYNHLLSLFKRGAPTFSLFLFFMAKVATFENARQLAAYYILLFPAVLVSNGHSILVRKRWWQGLGLAAILLTAFL